MFRRDGGKAARSGAEQQPEVDVGGNDRRQRERNANPDEVARLDLVAVLAQDADAGDVGRGADGRAVAAERRAGKQAEVQHRGLHAERRRKPRHHGQHRRDVGDVVNERGEEHRRPDDHRVDQEEVAAAHAREQVRHRVDDAHVRDAADDQEQAEEQADRLDVDRLERLQDRRLVPRLAEGVYDADRHQAQADQAVCDVRLGGQEGRADQQGDHPHQEHRGHVVRDLRAGRALGHGLLLLAEEPGQDEGRHHRAQLHGKEDARLALIDNEVQEAHVGVGTEHDGRRIAHQRRRALQVGGDGDGDDEGHGVRLELLADLQRDGRDHQHRRNIVHKRGNHACEQRQRHGGHLHVGDLFHDQVRQQRGHLAVDEELDQPHGPGDHHQDVEVDGLDDLIQGQHPRDDENDGGADRNLRPILAEDQHEHIGECEEENCINQFEHHLSFFIPRKTQGKGRTSPIVHLSRTP